MEQAKAFCDLRACSATHTKTKRKREGKMDKYCESSSPGEENMLWLWVRQTLSHFAKLCPSTQTHTREVHEVHEVGVRYYIDDVIIHGSDMRTHITRSSLLLYSA